MSTNEGALFAAIAGSCTGICGGDPAETVKMTKAVFSAFRSTL
jgi:hypothetical protein